MTETDSKIQAEYWERTVRELQKENRELTGTVHKLQEQLKKIKQQLKAGITEMEE